IHARDPLRHIMTQQTGTEHDTLPINIDDVALTNRSVKLRILAHVHQLGHIHHHVLGELIGADALVDPIDRLAHGRDVHGAAEYFNSLHLLSRLVWLLWAVYTPLAGC